MNELSILGAILIVIAGIAAGLINGVIGGGSLVTYLALTSVGVSPVLAASTNTVGVLSGNPAALISPIRNREIRYRAWMSFAIVTAMGSIIGGLLLILLNEKIFETIVPLLLLVAGLSVWIKPKRTGNQAKFILPSLFASGLYNGYFGPGQGILNLSILYRVTSLPPASLVILKNYIITASNIAVSMLFITTYKVVWLAIPFLWISVGFGGWLSSKVAGRLNEKILRIALTLMALIASAYFVVT